MGKIVLGLVGEANVNRADPRTAFQKVQALLKKPDILLGHFETSLADYPSTNADIPDLPFKPGWKHSKPENAYAWKHFGFDAVSGASNVSADPESTRLVIEELHKLGIPLAGLGLNAEEARKPAIVEKEGVKIGMLSYTSVFYQAIVPALANRPGAATVKASMAIIPSWRTEEMPGAKPEVATWLDKEEKALLLEDIAKLRPLVDYVVLSCHWGVSHAEEIQDYQFEYAHAVIDAGADIVMGHHPHRPQGIEIYHGKPIFYSMGNFAFDWSVLRDSNKEGYVAYVTLDGGAPSRISIVPVRREDDSNDIAVAGLDTADGQAIYATVERLSAPFGTKLTREGDEIVISL